METKFIIVVPVYNAEKYIKQCLESILSQDYENYELIVIDDSSTDNTYEEIKNVRESNPNFQYVRNSTRLGSPAGNIVKGINLLSDDDEDVIITVDGDDWLNGTDVLSYLNEVYQDDDVYMTYGQYEPLSHSYHNYCRPIPNYRTYRKSGEWLASHLRTFKKKVWDMVKNEDLRDSDGEYYMFATDTAWMYPLLEMCGPKHTRFISKVLYIYNDLSPDNEMKTNAADQLRIAAEVRNKNEYEEI